MVCVFESVQAILKADIGQYLKKKRDIFLKLKNLIDGYKETLQVFESQNGLTTLIGSLKAIIISQEFLSLHIKEEEVVSVKFNLPEVISSKYLGSEIPKNEFSNFETNNNLISKNTNKCELQPKPEVISHNANYAKTNDLGYLSTSDCIEESNNYQSTNQFSTLYNSTHGNIRVTTSVINVTPKYSCELCSFKSTREKMFQKHLKYHKKKDSNPDHISCTSCSEYFTHTSHYEEHMKNKHKERKKDPHETYKVNDEEKKNIKCQICGHEAHNNREYKKHLGRNHPPTYSCAQCEYKTKKKTHYNRHVKNVHENVRPFACQDCGDTFKRQDALRQHQFIHSREANRKTRFQCDICNRAFRSASYLREHMLTHSTVRSFLCEICGASFKTRPVHRNHMKVVHSQILQATCKICGRTFSTKYSLKRHVLQHENGNSDMVTDPRIDKKRPCSDNGKAKPSDKHVDLIASAWANASCADDIIETVYTGIPPDNFNISIDNQIPYIVHSTQEILTE